MSEEQNTPEIKEDEILMRYKRAHLAGWMTQQIVGGGATAEQSRQNFEYNDQKANAIMEKFSRIRETVLSQSSQEQPQHTEADSLRVENEALRQQLAASQPQ